MKHITLSMRPLIIVIASWLFILGATHTARAKMPPPIAHSIIRFETHSDDRNPDDFAYKMFSISRKLQNKVIGNFYYIYKHNLSKGDVGGHITGVNFVRIFSSNLTGTFGYNYTLNKDTTTRNFNTDLDRIVLALHYTPWRRADGSRLMFSAVHSTQTDWAQSRTLDLGISWRAALHPRWHSTLGYKYTMGISNEFDDHLFNQWNIDFAYKANRSTTINAEYLFVDKAFSARSIGAARLDDDHVFRLGMKYRYFNL